MHLETESLRRNTCHAPMVPYVKRRKKMETTGRQNGDEHEPCHSPKAQCEVLDLSTKRVPSATPNSSSPFLPRPNPSHSPSCKRRQLSSSATCSAAAAAAADVSAAHSCYSTVFTAPTTLTGTPYGTPTSFAGTKTGTKRGVESISPTARPSSDDPRKQPDEVHRYASRVEYSSPFSFAQLHAISPVTQPLPTQRFEMPPAIGTFPFNAAAAAAAAAAAVSPFIRTFPGSGQPHLTDVASSLPLQVSLHPHMDFASAAAAAAAATAFPSYLRQQRRRRRAQRCSDPRSAEGSPHLPHHPPGPQPTTGSRVTDDDCSRESANGIRTGSRNGERSHSEENDSAYLERRRKNNEAAKRSRDARRQKEEEIATRAAALEQENITLKAELLLLRRESAELHSLLYGRIDPQR